MALKIIENVSPSRDADTKQRVPSSFTAILAVILVIVFIIVMISGARAAHAGALPKDLHGQWCTAPNQEGASTATTIYVRKDCRDSDGTLTISPKGFLWWESDCDVLNVQPYAMTYGRTGYRVRVKCEGEGYKWTATNDVFIIENELFMNLVKTSKMRPL